MKLIVAKNSGFCPGVKSAVSKAYALAGETKQSGGRVFSFGELIHNDTVTKSLRDTGLLCSENIDDFRAGDTVIIRSHGIGEHVYEKLKNTGVTIVDATCPFVKKIHDLVKKYYLDGYKIVISGKKGHPEVTGINGWCGNSAEIADENFDFSELKTYEKLCFVTQTTFSAEKFAYIRKIIDKQQFKTVEIFDTICYTTYNRQSEAAQISASCDKMIIAGSKKSSNTAKLHEICGKYCGECFLIETSDELSKINFSPLDTVGIVTGASTPEELIMEVKKYMAQEFDKAHDKTFIDGVEESFVSYKEGKIIKGKVIEANENGIMLQIGGKKDGFISKDEIAAAGEYNPADYPAGIEIDAIITNKGDKESGCVLLSKKKVDKLKEGDKIVETIRNGEVFDFVADKDTRGGLIGSLGTYHVFIPASQIKEGFVKDLRTFVGKPLRLTALEIDDENRKIVASQRKVLETERKDKEEVFWSHVQPNVIVSGKVKRITNFGAFVSVDGFDCLAHIVDLSWTHIKTVEEVLKIGETYDFLVLSVDKEKGRVSLSYKLLQPHPFEKCLEQHPVGSVTKGKVTSIMPFGAFVEIEKGIEGLVHVSEAAHSFVKNIGEVVKVGDEVDVMILNADPAAKKITLSIKATLPETEAVSSSDSGTSNDEPRKSRSQRPSKDEERQDNSYSDDSENNPFKELLKGIDLDDGKKE